MKIVLYVFSGTGNTLNVAAQYKKYFGCDVTVYRVSKKSPPPPHPEGFDVVGIGYPIHAFNPPEPIVEFVKQLPAVAYRRAFIFKTSGEGLHLNDCSSQKLIKIMRKKGYDILLERHIVMPYNMIYRHTDEMAKQMWIYAQALVRLNCREVLSGKREKVKQPLYKTFYAPPLRWVEHHFAHIHGPLFKVDTKKCLGCNKCVNVCPRDNITIKDGKFKFGRNCVLCMGCSFGCPADAIHVGIFKYWKVNGDYKLKELEKDESIYFPVVPNRAKGMQRLYKKYFRECDKRLKEGGIELQIKN